MIVGIDPSLTNTANMMGGKEVLDAPPVAMLRAMFTYNRSTGELRWKKRPMSHFASRWICNNWNSRNAGNLAGNGTRRQVKIDGRRYVISRIIWTMCYGQIPGSAVVDHKNRRHTDNRLSNLRLASGEQNSRNRRVNRTSKLGVKGVRRLRSGMFIARIRGNGKRIYLGKFATTEDAAKAYREAAKKYHGEFSCTE